MKPTRLLTALIAVLVIAGGVMGLLHTYGNAAARTRSAANERVERPVTVVVAQAARRDVPIDLDGIGSVVAYKTVTVRAQVDGRLDSVLFREGQPVRKGEVLAQIDPRPFQIQLRQAQAALARDQALLTAGERNLERYTKLTEQKFAAQQQLDDQRGLIGQYGGAVLADQAQIESAKLNLSYARIVSPIDGVTGVRLIDPGNFVRAADAAGIVVVTQLDPISALFTLPQDDLPEVAQALRGGAELAVDAYDRAGTRLLASGKLLVIDNQINQTTATIRLKAAFPNPEHLLWPNQFVKVRLHVSTRKDALVVPTSAVQRGPQGTFVYVVNGDRVAARPIELELALGDVAVVRRGLESGERVVVEGQNQLREGARVQVHAGRAASQGAPP
jgi:multidrug efflux system membrane fusion protein